MSGTCPWRIAWGPHPGPHISDCTKGAHLPGDPEHSGMALPGYPTVLTWQEGDRREFTGEYPGRCKRTRDCVLPATHPRGCAL